MITIAELKAKIAERKGASAVSIVTVTEPKMRKTDNPYFGRVARIARRSGMVNANYENSVNRQRCREEQPTDENGQVEHFNANALWQGKGEYIGPSIVRHTVKGEEYLVFYPTHTDESGNPIASEDQWLLDGEPVENAETLAHIKSFCPVSEGSGRQETDKKIPWRVIKLENVTQVKMGGELLEIG
jgi:hypothetical protein